jgi:hypothetical protein
LEFALRIPGANEQLQEENRTTADRRNGYGAMGHICAWVSVSQVNESDVHLTWEVYIYNVIILYIIM